MHTVIAEECTGCELCLPPCPVECIHMVPMAVEVDTWKWPYPQATGAPPPPKGRPDAASPPARRRRKLWEFHGGLHLPEHKDESTATPIRERGVPERLIVPLEQHIGAPAEPLVKAGERVLKGQMIGAAQWHVSAPVHAPTSGTLVGSRGADGAAPVRAVGASALSSRPTAKTPGQTCPNP